MSAFLKLTAFAVLMMHCYAAPAASGHVSAPELLQRFRNTDFSLFLKTTNLVFLKDALGGVILKRQAGYVTGGKLESGDRHVGVAIYESHEAAIAAVEAWRKDVANIIEKGSGDRNGMADWWFSESQGSLIIVQDRIIFAVCDLERRYSSVSEDLWATAVKYLKDGL